MSRTPSATLIGSTANPIGLLYYIWMQSRTNDRLYLPLQYEQWANITLETGNPDGVCGKIGQEVRKTITKLIHDDTPVIENIYFTFALKDIPISLREQLVRHRIGVHVGPNQGVDQIPELGSSTFWAQTSRMVPMDTFYQDGRFIIPESIHDTCGVVSSDPHTSVHGRYQELMHEIETFYKFAIAEGIPMEDARQVIPLAATHNLTWTLNLKALKHILGKRACWIAQYGLWGAILRDMRKELERVSPVLRSIISPPCYEGGCYKSCPIKMINIDRIKGTDPYPPCPIYLREESNEAVDTSQQYVGPNGELPMWQPFSNEGSTERGYTWGAVSVAQNGMNEKMTEQFKDLWGFDPQTGEPNTEK